MSTLNQLEQLEEKQNEAEGMMTQAKGMVRERWGNLSGDEQTRLAGKKDQVVGRLQRNYGDSWIGRHPGKFILTTAVISFCIALAFIFIRSNTAREEDI